MIVWRGIRGFNFDLISPSPTTRLPLDHNFHDGSKWLQGLQRHLHVRINGLGHMSGAALAIYGGPILFYELGLGQGDMGVLWRGLDSRHYC